MSSFELRNVSKKAILYRNENQAKWGNKSYVAKVFTKTSDFKMNQRKFSKSVAS